MAITNTLQEFHIVLDKLISINAKFQSMDKEDFIMSQLCSDLVQSFIETELNLDEEMVANYFNISEESIIRVSCSYASMWVEVNQPKKMVHRAFYEDFYDYSKKYKQVNELYNNLQSEINCITISKQTKIKI